MATECEWGRVTDSRLRRVYGLLNGHGPELDELEALLPVPGESGERDSDELAGLEIDTPIDIDIDAALDTMQANLKAVERVRLFSNLTPAVGPPVDKTVTRAHRDPRLAPRRALAAVPHRPVGVGILMQACPLHSTL